MAYNENIKIGDLLNHEEAFVVLQKHLPEFVSEPTFKMPPISLWVSWLTFLK
ncbi:hypothetical protein [Paenibacillus sp. 8b26]|uniref:hypothetical protein n=1 Tax=Paenibacillus sp. 8b26 TaxID=3424133 RepID=UPI003D661AA5